MMRRATLLAALCLAPMVAPGCIPTDFDSRRDEASTIAVSPPEDYPNTRFGLVVAGYSGTIDGQFGSRVAATAGTDTPFTVYPLLVGDNLLLNTPVLDGCDAESPCDPGAGGSIVGMPSFRGRLMCLATVAAETGQIKVRCEDDLRFELVAGPSGERFGFAGAGLRSAHPFGSAIYGAPGALGGAGAIYRLGDTGAPSPLDLSMGVGVGRELGRSVAIGVVDGDTVLIAGGAPRGAERRVILATVDIDAGGAATTSVRGCVDGSTRGFGESIAIGDFDMDGTQDVAVGSGAGELTGPREDVVHIFAGSSMPAPGSCVGAWPEATTLSCPDTEGVTCGESALFGSALAAGDVNADGIDDLIVGAPMADVDGAGAAGAVYVFLGNRAIGNLNMSVAALTHSSPSTNANLGSAVAVAAGQANGAGVRRDEIIAGAPGESRAYVFLCTGIGGDSVDDFDGTRCQPVDN